MNLILCCSCFKMDRKAVQAFSLLFPDEPVPSITKGRDRIYQLGKKLNNDHILAISKLSGKFAYYVEMENNKVVKEYDLVKGTRIA